MNGWSLLPRWLSLAGLCASLHVALEASRHFGPRAGWTRLDPLPALCVEGAIAAFVLLLVLFVFGRRNEKRSWAALLLTLVLLQAGARWSRPSATHATGMRTGGTVVLLTLDTLRRDHVSAYPGAVASDLTPNLDGLAEIGVRFDDATAPAPLTLPSHTSYLTGLPPWEHGALRNGRAIPDDLVRLPEVMAAAGYRTAAFTSSPVLDRSTGIGAGFQVYRDSVAGLRGARELWLAGLAQRMWTTMVSQGDRPAHQPGAQTVSRALAWLGSQPPDASVFVWVHLYDAHEPYDADASWSGESTRAALPHPCDYAAHPAALRRGPPKAFMPFRTPLPAVEACRSKSWAGSDRNVEAYARQVRVLDHHVGSWVNGLKNLGRWDGTRMVVAGDHGESLVEHQALVAHEYWLSEPVVAVPLLVVAGDCTDCGDSRGDPVRAERLAETLREWAGVGASGAFGTPLSATEDTSLGAMGPAANGRTPGELANLQVSVRRGNLKVVRSEDGYTERYDLASDPRELRPQLRDADRNWVRAQISDRVRPPDAAGGLPIVHGPAVSEQDLAVFAQDGLLGDPVRPGLDASFLKLEEVADAALRKARATVSGRADMGPDEVLRESLEALGYSE